MAIREEGKKFDLLKKVQLPLCYFKCFKIVIITHSSFYILKKTAEIITCILVDCLTPYSNIIFVLQNTTHQFHDYKRNIEIYLID